MDVFNIEAAVKAIKPISDELIAAIEGAVDRIGATTITIGPITIPKFTITVDMPTSVQDRLNPPPADS